jgi:hypothetical protein
MKKTIDPVLTDELAVSRPTLGNRGQDRRCVIAFIKVKRLFKYFFGTTWSTKFQAHY